MIIPRHDRDGFFKYYTAEAAKLTLARTTRKWSTPLLFNDPFDNQFDLYFEEPTTEKAARNFDDFLRLIRSAEPLKPNQFGSLTAVAELIRQIHIQNPDFEYSDDEIAHLQEDMMEGMQGVAKTAEEVRNDIRSVMADTSVFCMSETRDNLLMWSHYARNHTGAVIKFLSIPEIDSPLIGARPVRYYSQMPRLSFASLMDMNAMRIELYDAITLSKADVWSYEKEWRIVTALRDKTADHEILPFAHEEIGEVYLGCRMPNTDRNEIIAITRHKYPRARIFQAEKHDREFALTFRSAV